MQPKIKIILYTSKSEKDGSHPIFLRIHHEGTRRHKSLVNYSPAEGRLTAYPQQWNKKDGRYLHDSRNKVIDRINATIDKYLLGLHGTDGSFSVSELERILFKTAIGGNFDSYIMDHITDLESRDRFGYASSFKDTRSAVQRYAGTSLRLTDITLSWVENFDQYLSKTCATNTRGIYHRNIRVLINKAIRDKLIFESNYPYGNNGFKIATAATKKRALSKGQMMKLVEFDNFNKDKILSVTERSWPADPDKKEKLSRDLDSEISRFKLSRDLFAMSYLCRGVNFNDLARWRWDRHVINNRIEFVREKTKNKRNQKLVSIKIEGKISEILADYTRGPGYIFPLIVNPESKSALRHQIKARLKDTNPG